MAVKCDLCGRRVAGIKYVWKFYTRHGVYVLTLCNKCDFRLLGFDRDRLVRVLRGKTSYRGRGEDLLSVDILVVKRSR